MPTYVYECKACGHRFEILHSIKELLRWCPKCVRPELKRIIQGGCGVIFKGTGFYETDYKRKKGKKDV